MLASLAAAALRTLLLAGTVQLCLMSMRVRRPQILLTCWTAVLAASLAMPLLQEVVTLPRPIVMAMRTAEPAPPGEDARLGDDAWLSATMPGGGMTAARSPLPWREVLFGVYGAVAGTMLLRLLLGVMLSDRLLRRARPLVLDGVRGLRVRVSPDVSGPVTLGSTVLLPPDCATWSEERLRAVVAHEGAHARAGDFYVLLLSQVSRALFWFSPVSWWLHRRLTLLAEMASDDVAVALLGDRVRYARVLLDMARQTSGAPLGVAPVGVAPVGVAMARPATMERRIERVLSERDLPARAGGVERILVAAGVLCLAAVAAVSVADRTAMRRAPAVLAEVSQPPSHKAVALNPELLDRYAGYYRDPGNGSIMIVTRDGGHLQTHRAGFPPVPEYPYTEHDFFLTTVPQLNRFVTGPSGAVVRVVHHQDGTDETLDRIDPGSGQRQAAAVGQRFEEERAAHVERAIDPALLDDYAGIYALEPSVLITISRRGHALFLQMSGRPAHEFHPYGDRDFFSTSAAAQISFVPGPAGRAGALVLHQGGRDRVADRTDPGAR